MQTQTKQWRAISPDARSAAAIVEGLLDDGIYAAIVVADDRGGNGGIQVNVTALAKPGAQFDEVK